VGVDEKRSRKRTGSDLEFYQTNMSEFSTVPGSSFYVQYLERRDNHHHHNPTSQNLVLYRYIISIPSA